jgi:hypothetical protein
MPPTQPHLDPHKGNGDLFSILYVWPETVTRVLLSFVLSTPDFFYAKIIQD